MNFNNRVTKYNRRILMPIGNPKANLPNTFSNLKRQVLTLNNRPNKTVTSNVNVVDSTFNEYPFQNGKLALNHENYTAYVFMLLFDAHYLPWLKNCYGLTYKAEFDNRLGHFNQSVQTAIDDFYYYKDSIKELAKKNAFYLQRKLKISLEEVESSSGKGKKLKNVTQPLDVFVRTTSIGPDGQEITFRNTLTIQLNENDNNSFIEIPIEMNNRHTNVFFEISLDECNVNNASVFKEPILKVQEFEISGYTGYNANCTFWNEEIKDTVNVKITLSWQVDVKSIQEQLNGEGHIVATNFSMTLLSLGLYFWRFFASLYSALLLCKDTEAESIKYIHEVAFIIDGPQKATLYEPLLEVIKKRLPASLHTPEEPGFESGLLWSSCGDGTDCRTQWHILHGAFLILEHLTPSQQNEVMSILQESHSTFAHLLRFGCSAIPTDKVLLLHRMGQRRLSAVAASKEGGRKAAESVLLFLIQLLIDMVKQGEQLLMHSSLEMMVELQCSIIKLFAKFFTSFIRYNQKEENKDGEEEDNNDNEDKFCSVKNSQEAEQFNESQQESINETSVNFEQEKENLIDFPLKMILEKVAESRNSSLLYSVLPAKVVDRLLGENVLLGDFYVPMMNLLGKIAQEMESKNRD